MIKEKVLVVGLGEVGRALFELLRENERFVVYGFDINEEKMREAGQSQSRLPNKVDAMLLCIPCLSREDFVNTMVGYVERSKPKLLIINSTVEPRTTIDIYSRCNGCLVAHSPVLDMHKKSGAYEMGVETLDEICRRR